MQSYFHTIYEYYYIYFCRLNKIITETNPKMFLLLYSSQLQKQQKFYRHPIKQCKFRNSCIIFIESSSSFFSNLHKYIFYMFVVLQFPFFFVESDRLTQPLRKIILNNARYETYYPKCTFIFHIITSLFPC